MNAEAGLSRRTNFIVGLVVLTLGYSAFMLGVRLLLY